MEEGLLLIQKLHKEGSINDDQRDALKDMLFDEDTTLLSFFENFSDPEDEQELKENIIKYVGGGNFGGGQSEDNTTGESLDEMSSPQDSAVDMKKKRRLAMLAGEKQAAANKEAEKATGGFMTPADCDIGASPVMSKGSIYSKKHGGGGKMSPIMHADRFKVGRKKQ